MAADVVAEQVQRRLDRDRVRGDAQELDRRRELAVERPRRLVLACVPEPDQLLHLRADDVRVHADAADAAELEERQDQVVVARVEVEAGLDDVLRLREVVVRLLDAADVLDLGQPRDRLGLDVEHDPAGDVVDDDRLVGRRRDGLEVRDDPALRRLVVVRRHDEDAVDAELVRPLGQVDRVARVVGAGAGDDGRAVADLLQRRGVELEALLVGERRALAGRAGDDEPVRAVVDEVARERAEAVQIDRAVPLERRHDRCQHLAEHTVILYPPRGRKLDKSTRTRNSRSAVRADRAVRRSATPAAAVGRVRTPRRGPRYSSASSPTVRPGGSERIRSSARSTPGTKASREVVSWRIVSVCPCPPKITS